MASELAYMPAVQMKQSSAFGAFKMVVIVRTFIFAVRTAFLIACGGVRVDDKFAKLSVCHKFIEKAVYCCKPDRRSSQTQIGGDIGCRKVHTSVCVHTFHKLSLLFCDVFFHFAELLYDALLMNAVLVNGHWLVYTFRRNAVTHSIAPVRGNISTTVTAAILYPLLHSIAASRARVSGLQEIYAMVSILLSIIF